MGVNRLRAEQKRRLRAAGWLGLWLLLATSTTLPAQVFISEVLFNPPGTDTPNEYIELRGTPNYVLSNGTFFVALNGDASANPGTVCNLFDLSGHSIGGNGFLALLQRGHPYAVNSNATFFANTNGPGWGSGSSSSIGHRGESGITELKNASITFLLLTTPVPPTIGDDVDQDNNGSPDGVWTNWTILDSVGVLDNDGAGDVAYGAINFRRWGPPGNGATASGTIVSVTFTPGYVARAGHSTGYSSTNWVGGADLQGAAPAWRLSEASTVPGAYDGLPLNHLGAPNFGAPALAGVVAALPPAGLSVTEDSVSSYYLLGLNTSPLATVTVTATAAPPLQLSTNGGANWAGTATLSFNNTTKRRLEVRATNDLVLDTWPHPRAIRHAITATLDPSRYPLNAPAPALAAAVFDAEFLLFNELKVNPPGTNDGPWEYLELKGNPGLLLTNLYVLSLEGDTTRNPGKVNLVVPLASARLDTRGLLTIGASPFPYSLPAGAAFLADARFASPEGALGNGNRSFLLVSSPQPILEGDDLDAGNNGILEGLPDGARILDSLAFAGAETNYLLYGPALSLPQATPDAALRQPDRLAPHDLSAWIWGDLDGDNPATLAFDDTRLSQSFPAGTTLSPADLNALVPYIPPLPALSGVIGDPTNPRVLFQAYDPQSPGSPLSLSATSTNQAVVANSNLIISPAGPGLWSLDIRPQGIGYSLITLHATNGALAGRRSFRYAASEMGRPGGFFHTYVADASAAFAVDSDLMFVGDDENQTLRLYWRNQSGAPIAGFDFTPDLNLTNEYYNNGTPKEMDIEGATRVGNRIYWISSQSNAETGDAHPNRNRILTTDFLPAGTNSQLTYVGRYEYLKEDILNWDASNQHGKGAHYYGLVDSARVGLNPKEADGSGYNIEGLTMIRGNTNAAYIGFRAPLLPTTNRVKALVLVISNFTELAVSGGPPGSARIGPAIELNLVGRAIRAMEATAEGVLIVAGPPGFATNTPPHDFRLFSWDGTPTGQPRERAADLSGLLPEGLVEPPLSLADSNSVVQLISDNGIYCYYGDDVLARRLPEPAFKKFRSDRVAIGPVVISRPILRAWRFTPAQVTLWWYAVEGYTYAVQYKLRLDAPAWTDIPGDVTAVEPITWKVFAPPAGSQVFYRIIVR